MNPIVSLMPSPLATLLEPSRRARLFPWALAGAMTLGGGLTLAYYLWAIPAHQESLISHLASLVPLSVSIPFTFLRARQEPQERKGWVLFGVSHILLASGAGLRTLTFLEVIPQATLGRLPFIVQLSAAVLMGMGMLSWPLAPPSASERRRKALDGLVFALALFFILWDLGWGDLYRNSKEPLSSKAFTLAFPLIYDVLVGLAIYLGARNPARFKGPLGWVTAGMLMSFIGNLIWGNLTLRGAYHVGHPLDVASFFIPLTKLVAPFSPEPVGDPPAEDEAHDQSLLGSTLPFLSVLPALGLGVWRLLKGPHQWDPILLWLAVAMGTLLLLRQFLSFRDLQQFSHTLELRVEERTQALEQNQRLMLNTVRMNTLASLGAGLAHDLNNLIGAARNYTTLAQGDLAEGTIPDPQDLERVQHALGRAGELTSSLMAFGRGEGGEAIRFDLEARVRESDRLLRVLLPRNIALRIETTGRPLPLIGQPAHWDQILVNLVSNARDAMPEGGIIWVRLRPVEGDRALLEVEDNGQGMPMSVQAHIFDAFFTTKAPGKGTGLGLASVRALVTQAGGELRLWSAEGKGTKFTLEWPLAS